MERILQAYARCYNPLNPVICYDERPCFLIGEIVQGLEMKSGQVHKEHYRYEKKAACNLLATIEPLTGKRICEVREHRSKVEFALHFQKVAAAFPKAEKIMVILDNLNTHNESSFYKVFEASEAKRLSDKIEFMYRPTKASWLNMIEIEFLAISRLCLDRRISSQEEIEKEVLSLVKEREEKGIKINWQFSIETARSKFNRHYEKVNPENVKHLKT